MRMSMILLLAAVAYTFVGVGVAVADSKGRGKTDSIVTCLANGGYFVLASGVPASINPDECPGFHQSECSPCIRSLEKQGCKILDVVVTEPADSTAGGPGPRATFLLSCEKP